MKWTSALSEIWNHGSYDQALPCFIIVYVFRYIIQQIFVYWTLAYFFTVASIFILFYRNIEVCDEDIIHLKQLKLSPISYLVEELGSSTTLDTPVGPQLLGSPLSYHVRIVVILIGLWLLCFKNRLLLMTEYEHCMVQSDCSK